MSTHNGLQPHWTPPRGTQRADLDRRLTTRIPDGAQRARVFATAERLLGHGPRPGTADPSVTGLALGYVQSGKTTSFTALSALAADSGYQVVIAFLGKTNLLTNLNTQELRDLLGVDAPDGWDYRWYHLQQPTDSQATAAAQVLQAGKVLLITLLKHPRHIANVSALLARVPQTRDSPTLIIDDEADQASLNTMVSRGDESRTYEEIKNLTRTVGPYLYVQYTATPFAPLLLEAADQLSPTFVEQLTPGPAYAGGETFFVERPADLVRAVTETEAADDAPTSLPTGLRDALGTFFVSTALAKANRAMQPPVSMLIHPSHLRTVHRDYYNLVVSAHEDWLRRLRRPPGDPSREADLTQLKTHYNDLTARGVPAVPWDDLVPQVVWALENTQFWLVNQDGDASKIRWDLAPVHVLVGENILDRGFVIRGLTTTYLTRGSRTSQADTVEQRARCFGYKRPYLDYCRVYAPPSVTAAFTALVHTEADMRARLLDHVEAGRPLASWATDVGLVLPPNMQPSRRNVLPVIQRMQAAGPFHSQRTPSLVPGDISANNKSVAATGILAAPRQGFGPNLTHHMLADVDVDTVLLPLLESWAPGDTPGFERDMLALYVRRRHEAGRLGAVHLLHLDNQGQPRRHGWRSDTLGMANLLQGRDDGTGYPGDRNLFPHDTAQLQVHCVQPTSPDGRALATLYTLVLHIPNDGSYPSTITTQDDIVVAL